MRPGIDRELLPIIHAEIDRLPDRYRAPIALCYLEGLSYEQAAHQLGWPLGTVGSRIARARELCAPGWPGAGSRRRPRPCRPPGPRGHGGAGRLGRGGDPRRHAAGRGASGATAAGTVSAAVALSDRFLRRMLMIRLIQMTSVLAVAATAGLAGLGLDRRRRRAEAARCRDGRGARAQAEPAGDPRRTTGRARSDPGPRPRAGRPAGPRRGDLRRPAGSRLDHRPDGPDRRRRPIPVRSRRERSRQLPVGDAPHRLEEGRADGRRPRVRRGVGRGDDPGGGEVELRLVAGRRADPRPHPRHAGPARWPASPSRSRGSTTRPRATSMPCSNPAPSATGQSLRGLYDIGWWTKEESDWSRRRSRPGPTAGSGSTARAGTGSSSSSSTGRGSARQRSGR